MIDDSIKEVKNYNGIVFNDYTCILISMMDDKSIDNNILGDMLADYVDNGGNVVLCIGSNTNSNGKHPAGRFTSYHPFILQERRRILTFDTVDICMRDHPIMNNVNTFNSIYTIRGEGIQGDTVVVGKWKKDRGNMIGVRYDKKGIIISIGCFCTDDYMKGDIYELLRNAVRYRKYN